MVKRTRRLAVVVAAALMLAACGGDGDSAGPSDSGADRQAVIDWLIAQDETPESAECFADHLSQFSEADFKAFDTAGSEADMPEGMADAVVAAAAVCVEG